MSDRVQAVLLTLRARFGADAATDDLTAFLAAEGFDQPQIGAIVARFRAESGARARRGHRGRSGRSVRRAVEEPAAEAAPGRQPPVRVLGPHEWGRFTTEAWGRLLALNAAGALTAHEFERLIDRALEQGEGRVDLPALRALLESMGAGDSDAGADTTTIH